VVGPPVVGIAMPLKAFEVPKYAQIVETLQARIGDGTYARGALIPSEAQLGGEFGVSRTVVVRALAILEQDGWIAAEQGRGRFVRRTQSREAGMTGVGQGVLRPEGGVGVELLFVGLVEAPSRAAFALGVEPGSPVAARKHVLTSEIGPVELATLYVPADLAAGTDLLEAVPLPVGVVAHLAARKGVHCEEAADRIGARMPTAAEARTLAITRREPVLTVLVTGFDTDGVARFVVDALIPPTRRELEDRFPLS
jgi:GntR family transcriptional regulator